MIQNKESEKKVVENPYASREEKLKAESTTPEGKRAYINQLQGEKKYEEARKLAEELVAQTKLASDSVSLLNICANYITDNKSTCVDSAKLAILADLKSLDFFEAYAAAEIFEKNQDKSTAKKSYERVPGEHTTLELGQIRRRPRSKAR